MGQRKFGKKWKNIGLCSTTCEADSVPLTALKFRVKFFFVLIFKNRKPYEICAGVEKKVHQTIHIHFTKSRTECFTSMMFSPTHHQLAVKKTEI